MAPHTPNTRRYLQIQEAVLVLVRFIEMLSVPEVSRCHNNRLNPHRSPPTHSAFCSAVTGPWCPSTNSGSCSCCSAGQGRFQLHARACAALPRLQVKLLPLSHRHFARPVLVQKLESILQLGFSDVGLPKKVDQCEQAHRGKGSRRTAPPPSTLSLRK